ncbi:MAG: TRAM domain-containing protein [Chloroflexota bacterium]|nr:TRAM domain-containing protein [Chloroflexota bacterium]
MNVELIFRIIGMLILAAFGVYWGIQLAAIFELSTLISSIVLGLVGAVIGFIFTPYVTTRPATSIRNVLSRISAQTLVAGVFGLIAGLLIAALAAFPLSLLPSPFGDVLPFIGVLIFSYFGIVVFVMRQDDIINVLKYLPGRSSPSTNKAEEIPDEAAAGTILLDTSVIIDGRIADIARTGFLVGSLLIPRFVLNELQYIADSSDTLRRQRGRRGMEVLSQLQKDDVIPVQISDIDVEGIREVDEKLVVLARQLSCSILTNDYNLNRIAELQGVKILNVNELANAVKIVFLPGESLTIDIIQEGREAGQGVAYLDDGTMVVVEDGRSKIGTQSTVTVTKVLQTAAGRMVFSRIKENETK